MFLYTYSRWLSSGLCVPQRRLVRIFRVYFPPVPPRISPAPQIINPGYPVRVDFSPTIKALGRPHRGVTGRPGPWYDPGMGLTQKMIEALPRSPGVYLLQDAQGGIIYVGKALNLRSRVRSYLGSDERPYAQHIRRNTAAIECLPTSNEKEALLLENQLIKAHRPRYNIDLKDDKSYVRIRVTTQEEWPAISITRRFVQDGATYFGPYSSAQATRKTLSAIGRIFPLRRCKNAEFNNRVRPCLYHSIGLCLAPCVRRDIRSEYEQMLGDLMAFLGGKDSELVARLEARMQRHAHAQEFEQAALVRDQIAAIRTTLLPQVIVGMSRADIDVFGTYLKRSLGRICALRICAGSIVDSHTFSVQADLQEDFTTQCILQFYLGQRQVPPLIYTDPLPPDHATLAQVLSEMRGARVQIRRAARGRPRQWLDMARQGAVSFQHGQGVSVLDELALAFHLPAIPYRMECYDISTLQGAHPVASRAVFIDASPEKSLYRHYRIRDVEGQDDFAMMEEVLRRRLQGDESRPDLIVLDGGKGQLNVCLKVLAALNMDKLPVIAMAKRRGQRQDRFFLPGRKDSILLPPRSLALKTLQSLRDEAHRFAVSYHRALRSHQIATSPLEAIPGIGPKKAAAILAHTAHLDGYASLNADDLAAIPGLNSRDIEAILSHLDTV